MITLRMKNKKPVEALWIYRFLQSRWFDSSKYFDVKKLQILLNYRAPDRFS